MKTGDTLHTKIVGVTKRNDCGDKIQDILEEISDFADGASLELEHEEDNSYDENAIKVFYSNEHIGYINRDLAAELAPLVDDERVEAELCQITGGDGLSYGCNILLRILPASEKQDNTPSYSPSPKTAGSPSFAPASQKPIRKKSLNTVYLFVSILLLLLSICFAVFVLSGGESTDTGSNVPPEANSTPSSQSASNHEETKTAARSLVADIFPSASIADVQVSDAQVAISVLSSATSIPWEDMEQAAQQASATIRDSLAPLNSVIYIQDDEGNNLLTIINGTTTYNAGEDSNGSGLNPSTITLAEFDAIQTGMSYQEVFDIIGGRGTVFSEVDAGLGSEYYTVIYQWDGEGAVGANANVTFQGGTVTAKAQLGLE